MGAELAVYRLRTYFALSGLWWAYQDLNLEPKHYECSALTD